MIKAGRLFKLKDDVDLSSYYSVSYVIVINCSESNMIEYRDVENFHSKYTAQICDFVTMFEPWGEDS